MARPRRIARLLAVATRGFISHDGMYRAAALAFDTLLGLVPLLVLMVSILKALGAYEAVNQDMLAPWFEHRFGPIGALEERSLHDLREAFLRLSRFAQDTEISNLGIIGLVALLYIVLLMLHSVEVSFDTVFGVEKPRSFGRKVVNYAALLLLGPLCMVLASALVAGVEAAVWWGPALDVITEVGSVLVAAAGITVLYILMPNRRVPLKSAALGGIIAALGGYVVFVLQVYAQLGVARYNLIYSGIAALPLFMLWVFFSWIAVLAGAEIAAAHFDEHAMRWRMEGRPASVEMQQRLAVRLVAEISRAFMRGDPAPTAGLLTHHIGAPPPLVSRLLSSLRTQGVVAATLGEEAPGYLPARDIDRTRVSDVLDALERGPRVDPMPIQDPADHRVRDVLERLHGPRREHEANLTMRELVMEMDGAEAREAELTR